MHYTTYEAQTNAVVRYQGYSKNSGARPCWALALPVDDSHVCLVRIGSDHGKPHEAAYERAGHMLRFPEKGEGGLPYDSHLQLDQRTILTIQEFEELCWMDQFGRRKKPTQNTLDRAAKAVVWAQNTRRCFGLDLT